MPRNFKYNIIIKKQKTVKTIFRFLALLIFCLSPLSLIAQSEGLLIGQVLDSNTKTPLSAVNIYIKNSKIGTSSNEEGFFMLRYTAKPKTVIFSSIGYKDQKLKIKAGEQIFLTIELEEKNTLLEDVFVVPGINPALEWMKKIRLMRKENDISRREDFERTCKEQNLILLTNLDKLPLKAEKKAALQTGSLSENDSSLLLPIYMEEAEFRIQNQKKEELSKNIHSSPKVVEKFVLSSLKDIDIDMNFYKNSVSLFGRNIISPLAGIGNSYYNYYLSDSIGSGSKKEYEIRFRTKNIKNLAFDGSFRFDSTTLAIKQIEASLPQKANINFIRSFKIKQEFEQLPNKEYSPQKEEASLTIYYNIFSDSLSVIPELLIKRSTVLEHPQLTASRDSIELKKGFAGSEYDTETVDEKLQVLNSTPLMKTARWIANAVITSYVKAGPIDVGPLQTVLRITEQEGFKMRLPIKTNEDIWKNISIGGSLSYSVRNKNLDYSAMAQWRLPTEKRRLISASFQKDYRRISYNYNRYIVREDPWDTAAEDVIGTVFSFFSAKKTHLRKEFSLSFSNEWSNDWESTLFFRSNEFFTNKSLPLLSNGESINSFRQQAFTLSTRYSAGTKKYDNHLQRIYVDTRRPTVYATLEAGRNSVKEKNELYGKLLLSVRQKKRFDLGSWTYMLEGGWIFGKIPYPLLETPEGNEPTGISFSTFNRVQHFEFGHDRFLRLHNEVIFNGILFNRIPLIRYLNLREIFAVKAVFGSFSEKHSQLLDFPDRNDYPFLLHQMKNPYLEGTAGFTNLFRCVSLQFHWRFTNVYEGVKPWAVTGGLKFNF